MAEGAPLLREYRVNSSIEGSNPSFSAIQSAAKQALQAERRRKARKFAGFFVDLRESPMPLETVMETGRLWQENARVSAGDWASHRSRQATLRNRVYSIEWAQIEVRHPAPHSRK